MNINEDGRRPHGWHGLEGNRWIKRDTPTYRIMISILFTYNIGEICLETHVRYQAKKVIDDPANLHQSAVSRDTEHSEDTSVRIRLYVSIPICCFRLAEPIDCAPGFYSFGRNESCIRCPAGKKCPNTDGTGIEDCPSGQYSEAGLCTFSSICIPSSIRNQGN